MYHPTLGRWTTPDPIEYLGGDENLYRSHGNNPLIHTDPTGLLIDKEHKEIQDWIRILTQAIKKKETSNCVAFAILMGKMYDMNLERKGKQNWNPQQAKSEAFIETMMDGLYYFTDNGAVQQAASGLLDRFFEIYRKRIPADLRNFKTPPELSSHDLGGLDQGYIQLPGDSDTTGRHDHFMLNAAMSATAIGLTATKFGEIIQRVSGDEKSETDIKVNGLGREFAVIGKKGRFKNGRELAQWIIDNLCDDSKCKNMEKNTLSLWGFPTDDPNMMLPRLDGPPATAIRK
jgi:hypothetical protein